MADEELRRIFAKNLNDFMSMNGFKQADLARHMNVSTATAAKWCTGQTMPRIDKIQSICNWLGVSKEDLLNERTEQDHRLDKEAWSFADFLQKNPDYKVIFDTVRKVKPEDVEFVRQMLDRVVRSED